jgi:bifunctional DNA-binding transcriptional regulator/antitoxin component of YhaV-PrlF toxin-antitoxin module
MRVLTRVDEEGRIKLPKNSARESGLTTGTPVEIKVSGPAQRPFVSVSWRARRQRPGAPARGSHAACVKGQAS